MAFPFHPNPAMCTYVRTLHYALPIIPLQLPKLSIISNSILNKIHKRLKYGEFTMQSHSIAALPYYVSLFLHVHTYV